MEIKDKIFIILLFVASVLTISAAYSRVYITKDFLFTIERECSPETENCFGYESEEGDTIYYKILEAPATLINNQCGNDISSCEISCDESIKSCRYIFCTDPDAGKYGECYLNEENTDTPETSL
ncbi:MAG TPA: hypothetical protein PLF31_00310 [Candidatus Paceibacterota bacterium]|nr:hypothetical protein [Candidatus Paceibacterota bacterium]